MAVLFWIFLDQICQKWIKLDQTRWNWISHQSKILLKKVITFTERICKNGCFVFDFFGSDLPEMDQTWSNWISDQSKNVTIKSCHSYRKDKNDFFIFGVFWIRSVQNESSWIALKLMGNYLYTPTSCFVAILQAELAKSALF